VEKNQDCNAANTNIQELQEKITVLQEDAKIKEQRPVKSKVSDPAVRFIQASNSQLEDLQAEILRLRKENKDLVEEADEVNRDYSGTIQSLHHAQQEKIAEKRKRNGLEEELGSLRQRQPQAKRTRVEIEID
jgi:hypothetical protein